MIDKSKMVDEAAPFDDDPEEAALLAKRAEEAKSYLLSFKWCKSIEKLWFAGGFAQVAVFYVEIDSDSYDNKLWVIDGDLPPAHLVLDEIPNVREALLSYVYWMREWVSTVKVGQSTKDCIPVNVEPTMEHAQMLESRLDFIEHEYIPSLGE
jgi:hypothetical protein